MRWRRRPLQRRSGRREWKGSGSWAPPASTQCPSTRPAMPRSCSADICRTPRPRPTQAQRSTKRPASTNRVAGMSAVERRDRRAQRTDRTATLWRTRHSAATTVCCACTDQGTKRCRCRSRTGTTWTTGRRKPRRPDAESSRPLPFCDDGKSTQRWIQKRCTASRTDGRGDHRVRTWQGHRRGRRRAGGSRTTCCVERQFASESSGREHTLCSALRCAADGDAAAEQSGELVRGSAHSQQVGAETDASARAVSARSPLTLPMTSPQWQRTQGQSAEYCAAPLCSAIQRMSPSSVRVAIQYHQARRRTPSVVHFRRSTFPGVSTGLLPWV